MWANRKRITVVAVLFVAGCALIWFCLNLAAPWLGMFPERNPVSVTFVSYTNKVAVMNGVGATNVPFAVFDISNRSAAPLSWSVAIDDSSGKSSYSVVLSVGTPLSAHSATRIGVLAPGGGDEDWRFTVALFRPRWQHRIAEVLKRAGFHPTILEARKIYPPFTNFLAEPSP
jgi:hypothetical protein